MCIDSEEIWIKATKYKDSKKWENGETVAKRNGCEKVKNFEPMEYRKGEINF